VRLLLEKGADIEAREADEWMALLPAANNGRDVVAGLLLEKGADIKAMTMDI
jgi:ankyrin repeat protein